jgi:hypothetical protein
VVRKPLPAQAGLFWLGTIVFGSSSFAVLAALSHLLAPGRLAEASAVFGLAFVLAVIPSAVQLRAAALVPSGGDAGSVPWRPVLAVAVCVLVAAPVLGSVLAISPLAIALLTVQIVPAVVVGARRGVLIGNRRLSVVAANLGLDACCRLVGGVSMGYAFGGPGLAGALLVATWITMVLVPAPKGGVGERGGSVTPFVSTMASLGMLMLLANVDVIVAPAALGPSAAGQYALAAIPAKGVFGALLAAGWLAVPRARSRRRATETLTPALFTVLVGVALAATLVVLRPVVATVLGGAAPGQKMLLVLGVAMALASGTSVCVHMAVARGARWPWPPLITAVVAVALVAAGHPTPMALATSVLAAHAAALVASLVIMARRRRES